MRTFVAASAVASLIVAGVLASACGKKDDTPQPMAPTNTVGYGPGQQCPPPGYPGQAPPGCNPYPTQPTGTMPPQPTGTMPPQPTIAPTGTTPPAPTATGMSTAGTTPCQEDVTCLTAKCNKAVGKCATPCGSTQWDCQPGNQCVANTPIGAACVPQIAVLAGAQVLP